MTPIRVLVADDHPIVLEGLVSLLEESGRCQVVAQASNGLEAVERTLETRPDVVILDLSMPRLNGLEATRRIRLQLPSARILVLTVHEEEEYILAVVRAGASGYMIKDSAVSDLLGAIETLASGKAYFGPQAARALADEVRRPQGTPDDPYGPLTPREREVFHLVVEGRTTKEVAKILGIRVKTADNHRARVLKKLGVHSTPELLHWAAKRGLLI